jgi:hypothetical protein
MTTPVTTTVECLQGCGVLGEGKPGDPVQGRKVRADWTRADELDKLAERHVKATRHGVRSIAVPA